MKRKTGRRIERVREVREPIGSGTPPVLISFLTFNRLGNTATTLPLLLRSQEDFELFLLDNGSKDDTWEFLNDTKDPRIKFRHRFDENIGVVHALNYILSHRKSNQDWINYEYDYRIHDPNFISTFRKVCKEFPELGAVSAVGVPQQRSDIVNEYIKRSPERYIERNEQKIYVDSIMGYCSFIPAEIMNQLCYYDEINCFADVELNRRIVGLGKMTGYALDIHASHTTFGGDCDTCIAYHQYCTGYNKYRERKCTKYYKRVVTDFTDKINMQKYLTERNAEEAKGNYPPPECDSVFSTTCAMSDEDKKKSNDYIDLFQSLTKEDSERVDLDDIEREEAEQIRNNRMPGDY